MVKCQKLLIATLVMSGSINASDSIDLKCDLRAGKRAGSEQIQIQVSKARGGYAQVKVYGLTITGEKLWKHREKAAGRMFAEKGCTQFTVGADTLSIYSSCLNMNAKTFLYTKSGLSDDGTPKATQLFYECE